MSVIKTLDGAITKVEEKTVDDILSVKSVLPQKLYKNDIVFNPYRINTGSIIYIDSNEQNHVEKINEETKAINKIITNLWQIKLLFLP